MLERNGHLVLVTARDKDVALDLLEQLKIPFVPRGSGKDSALGKLLYIAKADKKLFKLASEFKPDLFLSFSSPYAAHVAWLMRKPHLALNDTEHTDDTHRLFTYPFSSHILTPSCYINDLGPKHLRFRNFIEGLYLHKNYFTPNPDILRSIGIEKGEKFILFRLVSWNAHHDFGQSGLEADALRKMIKLYEGDYRIFLSSEGNVPEEFHKYLIHVEVTEMHSVLFYASAFIGESGTMASESALLGTPVLYVNSLPLMGYLKVEQQHGLLRHYKTSATALEGALTFKTDLINVDFKAARENLTKTFIDPTAFLYWFVVNYPVSVEVLKKYPDYQSRF